MATVYFHCSDAEHVFIARRGVKMNLADAREHAVRMVRSLVSSPSGEDWRQWAVHVTDEFDEEIFVLPFATVLGKLH